MLRETRSKTCSAAIAALLLAALGIMVFPAVAEAAEGVDLGTYTDRLLIEVPAGTVVEVTEADGGRTHRLIQSVELIRGTDGRLVVVNDVTMQTYLEGIAEMPVSWPIEALKAQVVAARTYSWGAINRGTYRHYDICATVACQVFRGRAIVEAPGGERWVQAVAETENEVLLHGGRPILARYFSTSGGHTRSNEDVFPSSGSRPYLQGVPDPEDAVSPLHTWQVAISREEMNAILAEGQTLAGATPFERFEVIPAGGGSPDRIRVVGTHGRSVVLNAATFRGHVSRVAPNLFPDRFPTTYPGSDRRLPETLPSSRITFTVTETDVIIDGRGFGHGVGMSQYGAMGKADAGMGYDEILAAYYNGLRPTVESRVPSRVRVGLVTGAQDLTFRADGPVRIFAGDRLVTERGLGLWSAAPAGGGVRLTAPTGFGAPLVVAPALVALEEPTTVHRVQVETTVNKPTELALVVEDEAGTEVMRRPHGVVDPGAHTVTWSPSELGPGVYRVALRAADETGSEAGEGAEITVRPVHTDQGRPSTLLGPTPGQAESRLSLVLAGIIGAMVGGGLAGRVEVKR
jgi:SpoIID/LytB domain protein